MAGVEGGALTRKAVLVVGLANLLADGLSMGAGNYLSIRAQEGVRRSLELPEEEARPARHGAATFLAFATAGALPLVPYVLASWPASARLASATLLTFAALFGVGALRSAVTDDNPVAGGLEMLGLGLAVAAVASVPNRRSLASGVKQDHAAGGRDQGCGRISTTGSGPSGVAAQLGPEVRVRDRRSARRRARAASARAGSPRRTR